MALNRTDPYRSAASVFYASPNRAVNNFCAPQHSTLRVIPAGRVTEPAGAGGTTRKHRGQKIFSAANIIR
ncbi:hypothetical protein [Acidiphilium sp.]|uniref:hypothetical protein n=1 Tax=Acidiphilium sp. TaxID=527 RepID=UPI003D01AF89